MNKKEIIHTFFNRRIGVLATMHHKEKVMSPLLEEQLGIKIKVPIHLDTDQFGTFTRDIERVGDQAETAKLKARYAIELSGETLAIASEGVFGPHPVMPWLPYNREMVFLLDQENKFELFGEAITTDTNYQYLPMKSREEAYAFCEAVGFPEHAVVVRANHEIIKGIIEKEQLDEVMTYMQNKYSNEEVIIETDMRALYNPTRMKHIQAATEDLIRKIYSLCSRCSYPGFEVVERREGLLCRCCGLKTKLIQAEIYRCKKCGEIEERLYPSGKQFADPSQCFFCNP
jgi:hypothetical protein